MDIPVEGQTPEVQPDPTSSFSFDSIHEKAMAYGSDSNTPPEQVATEVAADAVVEPAAEITDPTTATQAQLAQLKDDDLVEVTVDGEPVQMTWKDAKGGVMRQSHYTKSMQTLRQEQQAFEADRASLQQSQENAEVLRSLLKNPELLQQFIARQHPTLLAQAQQLQAAAEQANPDDLATVGQIQAAQQTLIAQQQQMQEQFFQELAAREEQITRSIEDKQATAKLSNDINTTIKGLFSENKAIADLIPNADQVLRYEVLQLGPTTPEETVEAFKTVFGGWVEKYNASVKATTKSTVLGKQKLTSNNIQPPGGAPPQPNPTNFKKVNPMTGKTEVDWAALRAVGTSMLGNK